MKFEISYDKLVKTHPHFLNGFTLNNLTKGNEASVIFTYVDHRFFIGKDTIPLPVGENKKVTCSLLSTQFSEAEEPEEVFSEADLLYKLGTLFAFGALYLDIENHIKKPIGVWLQKGCLALLDHKEPGRVVEMKTVGKDFEYFEIITN